MGGQREVIEVRNSLSCLPAGRSIRKAFVRCVSRLLLVQVHRNYPFTLIPHSKLIKFTYKWVHSTNNYATKKNKYCEGHDYAVWTWNRQLENDLKARGLWRYRQTDNDAEKINLKVCCVMGQTTSSRFHYDKIARMLEKWEQSVSKIREPTTKSLPLIKNSWDKQQIQVTNSNTLKWIPFSRFISNSDGKHWTWMRKGYRKLNLKGVKCVRCIVKYT